MTDGESRQDGSATLESSDESSDRNRADRVRSDALAGPPTVGDTAADRLGRRRFLGVLGTAGVAGIAGCSGGGSGDGNGSDGDGSDGDADDEDVPASDGPVSEEELWGDVHDFEIPSEGTGVLELGGETFEFETTSSHAFSDRHYSHIPFRVGVLGRGTWEDREFDIQIQRTVGDDWYESENVSMTVEWADPDQSGAGPTIGTGPTSELPERAQDDQPLIRVDRDEGVVTATPELDGLTMGADEVPGGEATLVVNCHTLLMEEDSSLQFDGQEMPYFDSQMGRILDEDSDDYEHMVYDVTCTKPRHESDEEFEADFSVGDDSWTLTLEYDEEAGVVDRAVLDDFELGTFEQTDPDDLADIEYVPTSHAEGSVSLNPADEAAEETARDGYEVEFELYCT